jgi:LAO/AO transport system kinase
MKAEEHEGHSQMDRPEWVPDDAGKEFATYVMPASYTAGVQVSPHLNIIKKKQFSIEDYVSGILAHDVTILSKAITLIESNSQQHINIAQQILKGILPYTGKSIRVGISGPPGAGKSTSIEALGTYLCQQGCKVAVLAIDPSSTLTKGSILGDKTRMEILSRQPNAYIRPSPSAGTLGGVARKTRETILACEAAGYDVILIETIGVGQSEITVRSMVDFFLLILIPGSGDELQGIKKGVVEISDMIAINKADGDNIKFANLTKASYQQAVGMLQPASRGWKTVVKTFSALQHIGIEDIWQQVKDFVELTQGNGSFEERRHSQILYWVRSMIEEELLNRFYTDPAIETLRPQIEAQVLKGTITPTNAVSELLDKYFTE